MSTESFLSDAIGALVDLVFLPGNGVIWLLLQFAPVAKATGANPGMYSSFQAGVISGVIWIAAFVVTFKAFKR